MNALNRLFQSFPPNRSHWRPVQSALLVLSLLAPGCSKPHTGTAETAASADPKWEAGRIVFPESSPQLGSITVSAVQPCRDCKWTLNGRLTWDDDVTVRIFSPFAGRIVAIHANPGSRVTQDSALATLASPDFGQAQADARKAATDLALAERNWTRIRDLADHGVAAAKDLAAAEADLDRARSESKRTIARLGLYGAKADTIDNAYSLKSPLDGVVVEKNVNAGQEVRPDQMLAGVERLAAPLFVVTDPAKLWVLLDVSEADAARLDVGQPLEIHASTHPDKVFHAVLQYESDALDPVTRTIKARALLDNSERQLKAEQLVSVEVAAPNTLQTFEIPAGAVFLKGDRHFVFAEVAPHHFSRREIRTSGSAHGKVRVTQGLQPGEKVVSDGAMLLEQIWESSPESAGDQRDSSPWPETHPAQS